MEARPAGNNPENGLTRAHAGGNLGGKKPKERNMKITVNGNRLLVVYSGVLTLVLALALLAAAEKSRKTSFGEIDVQRVNIVEPDGTVRLVLSSKALFPGIIFKKKEYPHPNWKTAGILFFDDEGTENGGLVYGGEKDKNGKVSAYGHLSFDQYDQDQVFTIDGSEDGGYRKARLSIWDRPDYSIGELLTLQDRIKNLPEEQQKAEYAKFFSGREQAQPRVFLGKSDNGSVSLRLNDKQGRERLIVEVAPEGNPVVRFLDQNGRETGRFPIEKNK
jgi:hypothetical protein